MSTHLTPEEEEALRISVAEVLAARARIPFISEISEATAQHFHIPLAKLLGDSRKREFARPRQVAMYLSKNLTLRSWPEIGRRFGGRDHTTVMHAHRQIAMLRRVDGEIDHAVQTIGARALAIAAARAAEHHHPESETERNANV